MFHATTLTPTGMKLHCIYERTYERLHFKNIRVVNSVDKTAMKKMLYEDINE